MPAKCPCKSLEEAIVANASETLAGIKTGSLFRVGAFERMPCLISTLNREVFSRKGLVLMPLRSDENSTLLLFYRRSMLERDLGDDLARRMLMFYGYDVSTPESAVRSLRKRFSTSKTFPHEVGLFIGYPPEDVLGFIKDSSAYKANGKWKVYSDDEGFEKKFTAFKRCREVYRKLFDGGRGLSSLTVAV